MSKKFTIGEAVKHLTSSKNLLPPGTKFEVTSNICTVFTCGTVGFMGYADNLDGGLNTLIRCWASIVRRGKTGKERLETARLIMPLIDAHELAEEDIKRYLVATELNRVKHFVQVERIKPSKYSLLEMPQHDYLGWLLAMLNYLYNISCSYSNRGISVWPQVKDNILNNAIRHLGDYFSNDPEACYNEYASQGARVTMINELRRIGMIVTHAELSHRNHIIDLKKLAVNAASGIYDVGGKKLFSSAAVSTAFKRLNTAKDENAVRIQVGRKYKYPKKSEKLEDLSFL
jgi:hypothetical protein